MDVCGRKVLTNCDLEELDVPWRNLKYSTDWHLLTRQNSYKPKIPLPIIDHIHVHQCRLT
jgi:adenine-specific DNA methylase